MEKHSNIEVTVVERTIEDIKILSAWLHTDLVPMSEQERAEFVSNIPQSTLDDLYDGLVCEDEKTKDVSTYLLSSYEQRFGGKLG